MSRRIILNKRKYNGIDKKNNDNDISKIITDNLFDNLINKKQKKGCGDDSSDNEDVYREYNHIYFRSDVSIQSIDNLLKCIREFEEEMSDMKSDPYSKYFTHPELYIHITTYGGDLYASLMAYDVLKSKTYTVVTIAEGYVASGGTIMMIGGKKRQIQKSALMLIHQLSTHIYGKFEEIKDDFNNSEQDMKRLTNIYHTELKGKMTKKQIEDALKHDSWWDAKTCITNGLCDEIL
jgi:ATP-dependent protease ClpP protease subunit